jgi:hypothetical protein
MRHRNRILAAMLGAAILLPLLPASPALAAGSLTGTVTDPEGNPVEGVGVSANAVSGPSTGGTSTAADGTFTITGLDPVDHTVAFTPPELGSIVIDGVYVDGAFLRWQYWPGVAEFADAEPVTVVDGATVNLDYTLVRRPVILGELLAPGGQPITSGYATAFTSASRSVASATVHDGGFGLAFDPAAVAVQGRADPTDSGSFSPNVLWFDGANSFADATKFDMDFGDIVSGVTIQFEWPKSLGGAIIRDSSPVDGWVAELYDLDGDLVTTGNSIGADGGGWLIDDVPNGQYKVLVLQPDPNGGDTLFGWFPVWYGGAPLHRFDRARVITVDDQSVFGLDVEMPRFFPDMFDSVFLHDIAWMQYTGITTGCGAAGYCPENPVTRGEMAAFLVRALGLSSVTPTVSYDDTAGSVFEQDIRRLATMGITRGCTDTSFCPESPVTRGQMAAFLVRALGYTDQGDVDFVDDDDSVFQADIERLATAGVTSGCSATSYCPDDLVTRGQMAAFLRRALGGGVLYPGSVATPISAPD